MSAIEEKRANSSLVRDLIIEELAGVSRKILDYEERGLEVPGPFLDQRGHLIDQVHRLNLDEAESLYALAKRESFPAPGFITLTRAKILDLNEREWADPASVTQEERRDLKTALEGLRGVL